MQKNKQSLGQLAHKLPLQDLLLHLCGPEWTAAHHAFMISVIFQSSVKLKKQTLSWLEKEVRPKLHREAIFHGKVDTPIALLDGWGLGGFPSYATNGNCLWNAFVTRQDRILPTPVTMFAIDEYVSPISGLYPKSFFLYAKMYSFLPQKIFVDRAYIWE